jgi:predicted kinase
VTDSGPSATLYVMVGLPAAGKTTRARRLAEQHRALRLTPDEWMIPLFGEPDADGKRDVVEGRMIWLAEQALRLGTSVVLDFGVWSRDERWALRSLAADAGAACELVYLPVRPGEQWRRVQARRATAPRSTFELRQTDLAAYEAMFEPPDDEELAATGVVPPPPGHETWRDWTAHRWPTSVAER